MRYQFGGGGLLGSIPTVVKNLLIINVLMLVIAAGSEQMGVNLSNALALHHYSSDKFMIHQLVTHIFMHADIMHLFFNMFALFMFGRMLESKWGAKRFLTFYMICGLGAAGLQMAVNTYEINQAEVEIRAALENHITDPGTFDRVVQKYIVYANPDEYDFARQIPYEEIAEILLEAFRNQGMVGASGAVFGILMGFGMLFPNTVLMLLFPPIPIKAKYE